MSSNLERLQQIVADLRHPERGCPWDIQQTHASILENLIEESYEFIDAVEQADTHHMREELGDILLQIMLHTRMAEESGSFTLDDVAREIADKLVRRHPHVFGTAAADSTEEVLKNWDAIKAAEKGKEHRRSVLDGIPRHLPGLQKAQKIQKKAEKTGFDWEDAAPALDKVEEEFGEFREALAEGRREKAVKEFGDILFSLVNVARKEGFSADEALRASSKIFERRFRAIEDHFEYDHSAMKQAGLKELDALWDAIKKSEQP
ncbi:MAG: nucleoside triphosphate pyrophosphohydrolase [Fibrobacterota bacterium]